MGGAPMAEAAPLFPAGEIDHKLRSAFFSGE
jgi:hypothetical protein